MTKRFLAGVALGAFFLWLALRHVDLGEIAATIRSASPAAFATYVLLYLVAFVVRSARWRVLMRPLADVPVRQLLPPLSIGFMVNFLLPGRVGEVVRAWLLGRKVEVSMSATFATVVVERLFDGLAIFLFLGLAPFLLPAGEETLLGRITWVALGVLGVYVCVIAGLYLLGRHREALTRFLARHPAVERRPLLMRIVHLIERFAEGLGVLRSGRDVFATVALSLAVWGLCGFSNMVMMRGIGLDLPGYAPYFLMVLQGFGVLIPSPGFVGPFQYAHVVALGVYGVSEGVALSLALLIHAALFTSVLGPGFFFAAREHLGWKELKRVSRE